MLKNNALALKNEIVSNFGIYDSSDKIEFIFTLKPDKSVAIDYSSLYEKIFVTKKNVAKFSVAALKAMFGQVDDATINALRLIVDGDFTPVKTRDEGAIKLLKYLAEIVDIISSSDTINIISSVRDSASEFNTLTSVLSKLTGVFQREDADRFNVISDLVEYFKTRGNRQFKKLVELYSKLSPKIDYSSALKENKNVVSQIIDEFNSNEEAYKNTLSELASISPKLFGGDATRLLEKLEDKISDAELDSYKHLITFYCQHLDALVELAEDSVGEIAARNSAVDDSGIDDMRSKLKSEFGENCIVSEKLIDRRYMFAISFVGRYEPVAKFITENEIHQYSVLMVIPKEQESLLKSPSLEFLIESLSGDIDDAIDNFGKKADLIVYESNGELRVQIIGSKAGADGHGIAMVRYIALLAVIHGFDASNLPSLKKYLK